MRPGIAAISIIAAMAAVASAALSLHDAAAYQHVANGGFESGLNGWAISPGANAAVTTDAPAEGSANARITVGGTVARLEYAVPAALAAGTYRVSMQGRASSFATLRISVQPSVQPRFAVADDTVASSWSTVGGAFTLNEAAYVTLILVTEAALGTAVDIDDVHLDGAPPVTFTPTPTPPPGASTTVPAAGTPAGTNASSTTPVASPTTGPILDLIAPSLRNTGFEQLDAAGLPFAWEKYGGTLSTGSLAHGGQHAARLESTTSSTKWLHQAVTVNGANWYAFDAWVLHNDGGIASGFLRISWYASSDASGQAIDTVDSTERLETPSSAYRHLTTGAVQAPPDARSARVRIMLVPASNAPAAIVVDDAWFGPASPPLPTATPTLVLPIANAGASTQGADPPAFASRARSERASSRTGAGTLIGNYSALSGTMVINEVLYDADKPDVADPDAEWVELYNAGDAPIDLAGWSLGDATAVDVLPSLVVPPRGFAIVAATDAITAAYPDLPAPVIVLNGRIGNALGNDGDRVLVLDPVGAVVDAVSWGDDVAAFDPSVDDVPSGHSIEREFSGVDSNSAADFTDNERPSPGFAYAGLPDPKRQNSNDRIRIIEGGSTFAWLPWTLAATAAAACAAMLGWRTAETVRRGRQP